jgi:hypothetical protein
MLLHRRWRAGLLACVTAAASCASDGQPTAPDQGPPADWTGPSVHAVATTEGGIEVLVMAPTTGYSLLQQDVTVHGDAADADFKLTTPAADAVVGDAITELRARVGADQLPPAVRTVRVRIATWQDGVQYFRAPDHVLAAVVAR